MSTIVDRGYVEKKEARFWPTELGILVNGLLVVSFPEIVSTRLHREDGADLDHVEEGTRGLAQAARRRSTRRSSSSSRRPRPRCATSSARRLPTEWVCEKCGKPMVIKWGRNGSFLACQGYPECRNTMEVVKNLDGTWEKVPPQTTDEICETCGAPMTIKRGRFGSFLACTRYPDCKTTKPISLGVKCPRPGCGGFIAEKRSRRGKPFYGCSNWAKKQCDFVAWDKPDPAAVPDLQREVRAQEGDQARHHAALHGVRLASRARTTPRRTPPDRDAPLREARRPLARQPRHAQSPDLCPACRTPNLVAFVRSYRYRCNQCAAEFTRVGMQFVREGGQGDGETIPSRDREVEGRLRCRRWSSRWGSCAAGWAST